MINDLIEFFKGKKILILGFGREGISTYNLIRKYLPEQELFIADKKENFQDGFDSLKKDNFVTTISGEKYLNNLNEYDKVSFLLSLVI